MVTWATSESAPMSPSSRYTILRKIADGGTAEIFLAKQHGAQGFEKTVVLKRIFTTFYADPQFRHMLVDEAHIAMTLNHSNIVQVLDLGEADGRYFLALELVDGWTLDRVLRRSKAAGVPFPPALALYLTAEVCRALAYAHNKKRHDGEPLGIVHRDISPHNVLLSRAGRGQAHRLRHRQGADARDKESSSGKLIKGKIAFMSPEQASGEPLDARSDLFSVGTMLYVMITRRHPFDAPTDYETLMLVKAGDFVPPETARPGLNPELYRVIRKAMAKPAGDRYQTAEEMLVDVEQVMRVAFRPVGQTELQRWLADLSAKDGVPPLTREAPPEPPAARSTVGPLRGGDGQESGLMLNLDEALRGSPRRSAAAATGGSHRGDDAPARLRRQGQALVVAARGSDRRRHPDPRVAGAFGEGAERRRRARQGASAPPVASAPAAPPSAQPAPPPPPPVRRAAAGGGRSPPPPPPPEPAKAPAATAEPSALAAGRASPLPRKRRT